jgi:drug/metabolite transporter (DMT)-like permease
MANRKPVLGHLAAFITISIWASTFISIKILLKSFSPVEIMVFRLVIAWLVLLIARPRLFRLSERKQEWLFMLAGLSGVTLYSIFQNIALTYTYAANASVLISIAPFFIAIFSFLVLKEEKPGLRFFIGFVFAILGIFLISFNGRIVLKLNPLGDMLCILAAVAWGVYSVTMRKISGLGYDTLLVTRRVFFYGTLFILPFLGLFDFRLGLDRFASLPNLLNILFLGVIASAFALASWNFALGVLGSVRASVYIYGVPVLTLLAAWLLLSERITWMAGLGVGLILLGLLISEGKLKLKSADKGGRLVEGKISDHL